jgi:glycosyltransferase involved in cell wall biosynthesis
MEGLKLCVAYPNKFTYSETFVRNQVEALAPDCQVYEGWHPALFPAGGSLLPFPLSQLPVRGVLRNTFPGWYHSLYSRHFASFLVKHRLQLVVAHYGPMGTGLLDACRAARVPLVVHFHGFDAYHYPTLRQFGDAYRKMFAQARTLIAVSGDMQRQLISLGAPPEKVVCNPYGVDLAQFAGGVPGGQPPVFLTVGRFTAKKAPFLTIKAFARVKELCPEARLVMAGEGELWEESKELARSLGLTGAVEFKGRQTTAQIRDLLRAARVFVQHSLRAENGDSEGTPNSILEAAATGLPVVSTQHAGIKDAVIHGESGFLVPEGDVEGMAGFMYLLATDYRLAAQMGGRGRRHMEEHYAMDKRINTLKQVLRQAAGISDHGTHH